ncbi:ComEC/Rec2 family competence protein [Streptomyces sp. NPDC002055]|uniref:ComEC/Rec2 family competence protein n=1 Tax=Streptomyces sp. NPDC002055 TaxID=3154534 RepID=UPI00332F3D0D
MTNTGPPANAPDRPETSDPAREGPLDLRLVAPALAAWAATAWALHAPMSWAMTGAALCLVTAAGLLVLRRTTRGSGNPGSTQGSGIPGSTQGTGIPGTIGGAGTRGFVRAGGTPHPIGGRGTRPVGGLVRGVGLMVAAALLCAGAAAISATLHAADLRRGPLPESAVRHVPVTVELRVTGDPRLTRPRVVGAGHAPAAVVLEAEAERVTGPRGEVTTARTPVLVIVQQRGRLPSPSTAARRAGQPTPWLRLLPSTRLLVRARPTVPSESGGRPVAVVLRVSGGGPPQVIAPPTTLQRAAGELRAGLREATDRLSPDARALLPGLVVGDTSRMPPDLDDAFHATDLVHLTAVSGANLTIVLALLIGPPHLAVRAERRGVAPRLGLPLRTTALLGGLLTLGFVIVCRPEPSVLRAAACGLVTLLAIATGRRRSLLPALCAAVLLLVLYDPWLALSYGFLLSVLATAALLTIAPRWSSALQRRRVPARLAEVLAAAAAAQAVCAPVVVLLAARVSLVAIPCNLLAEPAVAPATVLGFAALATAPVAQPVAAGIAWLGGWPAEWVAGVARAGAALPGAEVEWPEGWAGGLLLAAITGAVVWALPRLMRHPWLCGLFALLLVLAVTRPAPLPRLVTGWPPPGWRFAVCDVGQGDALVLPAGDGTAVVVDAGPDPVLADRCLRSLGVTRIPLIVLTHFHADHVAGLPGVLRGRSVGAIETTLLEDPPDQAAFVRRVARAAGVRTVRTAPGDRQLGPLRWRVLWPLPRPSGGPPGSPAPALPPAPAPEGANDASVTLLVRTAGLTLLLLGDLEPPAQQSLLTAVPDLPPVDVLKVAHHGSAYQDPRLLSRVRPRLAVISCGADNPYGHPSPRTVAMLRQHGAAVLRTDTDGSIAVTGPASRLGAALGRVRSARRRRTASSVPGRRTAGRWRGEAGWVITGAWIPHGPTPTSSGSEPPGRREPMPKPCASCRYGTSPGCRSRTSASISVRTSCSRRTGSSTRSCGHGEGGSATN